MRASKAPYIEQRASVTMSWLEAKLAGIFFLVNIMIHEQSYGTIPIPRPVLPPFIGEEQAGAPIDTIIASITAQVAADVANAVREAREASKSQNAFVLRMTPCSNGANATVATSVSTRPTGSRSVIRTPTGPESATQ